MLGQRRRRWTNINPALVQRLLFSRYASTLQVINTFYDNNNFREILQFENLSSSRNSRKLKPREYYQIYSITCHNTYVLLAYSGALRFTITVAHVQSPLGAARFQARSLFSFSFSKRYFLSNICLLRHFRSASDFASSVFHTWPRSCIPIKLSCFSPLYVGRNLTYCASLTHVFINEYQVVQDRCS